MAKSTQIQLRASDDEKRKIKAAADKVGESLSEFILKAAMDRATETSRRTGKLIPHVRIGREEIAVAELLSVPVFMKPAEEK